MLRFIVGLFIVSATMQAHGIAENDFRFGVLAGNFMPQGALAAGGNGIGYGLHFAYMFSDDLVYEMDFLSSSAGDLTHTGLGINISNYYEAFRNIYLSYTGGMTLILNSLTSGTDTAAANGVGLGGGAGIDFDLSSQFVAGFQVRYYYGLPVKKQLSGSDVTVVDSFMTILSRIAYVY